jgi:hypothetical protein
MTEKLISITPTVSPIKMDVMVNDRWRCTLVMDVVPGIKYTYRRLKSMARRSRPSLGGVDFDLLPCFKPVFRN